MALNNLSSSFIFSHSVGGGGGGGRGMGNGFGRGGFGNMHPRGRPSGATGRMGA